MELRFILQKKQLGLKAFCLEAKFTLSLCTLLC